MTDSAPDYTGTVNNTNDNVGNTVCVLQFIVPTPVEPHLDHTRGFQRVLSCELLLEMEMVEVKDFTAPTVQ